MEKSIFRQIKTAYQGRKQWLKLVKKYNIAENDCIILMPSDNSEWNRLALKHLDEYLDRKYSSRAIVLSYDQWVLQSLNSYSKSNNMAINFTRNQAELLMQYYLLYVFFKNFVIISLTEPLGNMDEILIGKNGINAEDLICLGIYRLPQVNAEM